MYNIWQAIFWEASSSKKTVIASSFNFAPRCPVDSKFWQVQVLPCAEHVTSHQYLNQWWPISLTYTCITRPEFVTHDDLIKWKHFLRYWRIVLGIHRSPVNFPHKGQWRAALMFSLICIWIDVWVNNWDTGDLRCHGTHYDVTVMK